MSKVIKINECFFKLMGLRLGDSKILDFISKTGLKFAIEEIGDDVFFTFENNSLEILFRKKVLDTIFFNIKNIDDDCLIFDNIKCIGKVDDIISKLPESKLLYGGGEDSIIGFIDPWVKFKTEEGILVNLQYDIYTHDVKLLSISLS